MKTEASCRRSGGHARSNLNPQVMWVGRIGQALAEDRFILHAQPIVALNGHDERPRHELLIRQVDRSGRVIAPARFLPVAERFDLIQEIDRWVIAKTARLLAEQQSLGNDVVFEINLSPKTLVTPGLADFVIGELRTADADPRGLCLEFTETAAIVNMSQAHKLASRLHAIGCTFAIDDFGAGFASLYYVKHLDFDFLKIDGEFIADLPESETDRVVVEAVVAIARAMGKRTVAECVESGETLEILRELGVDFAQGFHLGKPVPFEDTASARAIALA